MSIIKKNFEVAGERCSRDVHPQISHFSRVHDAVRTHYFFMHPRLRPQSNPSKTLVLGVKLPLICKLMCLKNQGLLSTKNDSLLGFHDLTKENATPRWEELHDKLISPLTFLFNLFPPSTLLLHIQRFPHRHGGRTPHLHLHKDCLLNPLLCFPNVTLWNRHKVTTS